MPPEDVDSAYLWDMLQAARAAQEFAGDLTLEELLEDRKSQYALAKALELIGEAANKLSKEFFQTRPQLGWQPIMDLRHRLVHHYGRTNFRIVWDIVTREVPVLIPHLDALLREREDVNDEQST